MNTLIMMVTLESRTNSAKVAGKSFLGLIITDRESNAITYCISTSFFDFVSSLVAREQRSPDHRYAVNYESKNDNLTNIKSSQDRTARVTARSEELS